jgi:hypothetical protein
MIVKKINKMQTNTSFKTFTAKTALQITPQKRKKKEE